MGKPKRQSFVHWLRAGGHITEAEVNRLGAEWREAKREAGRTQNFTTAPVTWSQFVARKYPHKVPAYQAYLRLIGAAEAMKKGTN